MYSEVFPEIQALPGLDFLTVSLHIVQVGQKENASFHVSSDVLIAV